MTTITLAKSAGFCFGVRRAVDAVYRLIDEGRQVCTLGPIIHNPQVTAALAARGVRIVESPADVPKDATLVIRSHGVTQAVQDELTARGLTVWDATCPFVHKIHEIVREQSQNGAVVLIAGDEQHPEVIGIRGHCVGESYVFSDEEQLKELLESCQNLSKKPVAMVAQTTFHLNTWRKCVEIAKKYYTNPILFDTICNATAERQREAEQLSLQSDRMVIIGGRQSSNTAKLRDVCLANCPTVLVETAEELSAAQFAGVKHIGVTAGASTPTDTIKEVLSTMSEIVNNEVNPTEPQEAQAVVAEAEGQVPETVQTEAAAAPAAEAELTEETPAPVKSFEEMSFEEALEASLQSLNTNERVKGIVTGVSQSEVQVEVVGRKQTGYVPADELTAEPGVSPADMVKVGDELELLIMRTNDQEGTIMLSKKRVDSLKGWDTVVAAGESGEILEGTVTDIIKGGMLVVTNGVRVFVPASQASSYRMEDLSPLKGTKVRFRIIETNQARHRAVGSVRAIAREERKEKETAFWAQAEEGQQYTGVVKSLTSFGAFVDLGGVDGMVHISELSWNRIKHPSEVISVGDTVEVYIKKLDPEKKKISLGYRKSEDNPWEQFKTKYAVGDTVTAKVVGMPTFGAFVQILPGVDGLVHISQIANRHIEKPQDELKIGQEVVAKITNIDAENKRISLSIRALLPEDAPVATAAPAEEAPVEEAPAQEAPTEE